MSVTNKSKVSGAVIVAAFLVVASNFFGNLLIPFDKGLTNTDSLQKNRNTQVTDKNIKEPTQPYLSLLTTPNAEKGKTVAKKCASCHSFNRGGKNKVGPNLYNILNRDRAAIVEFNYSKAIKKLGGKWSLSDMDKYIHNPKKFLPGTKMSFKGIKNADDRASLILYLNRFADTPIK